MHTMKHLCFTSLREQMSENFNKVKDWRHDKKVISIHDAIMSGFACMFFQEPSLLRFQIRMQDEEKRNNFNSLFDVKNLPRETQMRDIIDLVDSEHFRPVFKNWYQRLQRGKQLEQYQAFSGLYYFPIDGSEFYSSNKIHCKQCLHKEHENGVLTHSHQILQGGIMHPDCSEVIPFMPEQIVNSDGADKQDCEINAAKRYIKKLSRDFPQLGFIIGGDDLFSREPLIQEIKELGMHFIFTAKPTSHKYMMEWLAAYPALNRDSFTDKKGRIHVYEWMNEVPLTGKKDPVVVNFFRCTIIGTDKKGKEKVVYKNNWVTDLGINTHNIRMFVKTGRCRWKVESAPQAQKKEVYHEDELRACA